MNEKEYENITGKAELPLKDYIVMRDKIFYLKNELESYEKKLSSSRLEIGKANEFVSNMYQNVLDFIFNLWTGNIAINSKKDDNEYFWDLQKELIVFDGTYNPLKKEIAICQKIGIPNRVIIEYICDVRALDKVEKKDE